MSPKGLASLKDMRHNDQLPLLKKRIFVYPKGFTKVLASRRPKGLASRQLARPSFAS
jgi:hypothetical protein